MLTCLKCGSYVRWEDELHVCEGDLRNRPQPIAPSTPEERLEISWIQRNFHEYKEGNLISIEEMREQFELIALSAEWHDPELAHFALVVSHADAETLHALLPACRHFLLIHDIGVTKGAQTA